MYSVEKISPALGNQTWLFGIYEPNYSKPRKCGFLVIRVRAIALFRAGNVAATLKSLSLVRLR